MRNYYIKLPGADAARHASVREDTSFFPFKGALGAIDGTHIPTFVKKRKHQKYINMKNFVSQNIMAVVDFDMNFVYVSIGWEGSAADMKVLRDALDDGGFTVPQGRYYLVDSGYANTVVTDDGENDEDVEQSGVTMRLNETQLGDLLRTCIRNVLWENMQNRNRNSQRRRN